MQLGHRISRARWRRGVMGACAGVAMLLATATTAAPPTDSVTERNASDSNISREGHAASDDLNREKGGSLGSSFYLRTDSDSTVVMTPSVHFRKSLGADKKTGIDIVYVADIWTSASIDVRSAASEEIVEQRDELDLGVDREVGLWSFGAGYRYSHEVDYVANSLTLNAKFEAFQRNTIFEGRVTGAYDVVGRSGDDSFSEPIRTVGAWIGFTQVLTKHALMQLSFEKRVAHGFQSSPYRFVPIGEQLPNCKVQSGLCLPEAHPGLKVRNAAVVRLRHALGKRVSIGAGYRFYWDMWKIQSHTVSGDIAASLGKGLYLSADARYYTQSAAFFYQPYYSLTDLDDSSYLTRDRELSALTNRRFGARLEYESPLSAAGIGAKVGLMGANTKYKYKEFPGLNEVTAWEVAMSLGVVF